MTLPVWLMYCLLLILAAAGVVVLFLSSGSYRWHRRTLARVCEMEGEQRAEGWRQIEIEREVAGLPAPVRRYLLKVLGEGVIPEIRAVTLEQRGTFNLAENDERWVPFEAVHRTVSQRPGFVWDAKMRMAPGLGVSVHDAYVAGEGALHGALGGWVTVVKAEPSPELARGELLRFLAESPWYPTLLVPRADGEGIRWKALDERSALATLEDGGITVALVFRFGTDALVEAIHCEDRGRLVAGHFMPTPWEGRWSDYEDWDGVLIPTRGEVSWVLPDRVLTYWRGQVVRARLDRGVVSA